LFEAANRIMSDLAILHGVKCLRVEFGHENNNGFDITADNGSEALAGEAFNVAASFFPVKRNAALKKLRSKPGPRAPAYRLLTFNREAVRGAYRPRLQAGEYMAIVDIAASATRMVVASNGLSVVS
jgi:hypothetical protein